MKIRGARIGLPSRMNLVVGRLTCNPGGLRVRGPGAAAAGREGRLRLGREHQGSPPRRPGGGADRAPDPEGPGGTHHPRPRAGPAAPGGPLRVGRPVRRPRGALRPARPPRDLRARGRGAGGLVRPDGQRWRSRSLPPPPATPSGRVLEVLGRLEEKGVDLKVVMAKYGLPDALSRRGGGGGGGGAPGGAPRGHRGPHRLPALGHRHGGPRDRPRPRRRHQPGSPAERPLAAGRAHRRRGPLRPRGLGPRPGGLPARHLGLLPRPRGAHAAARAQQQHLQPGGRPGPPDPVGGDRAGRQGPREAGGVPRRRHQERRPHELPAGAGDRGRRRRPARALRFAGAALRADGRARQAHAQAPLRARLPRFRPARSPSSCSTRRGR